MAHKCQCKKQEGLNLGVSFFICLIERRYRLKAEGWTLTKITERVVEIFGIEKGQMVVTGKQPNRIRARSVLAYWAIRDLGMTATAETLAINIGHQ